MKKLFLWLSAVVPIAGCTEFDEPMPEPKDETTQTRSATHTGGFEVMPNPYALDVMQAVYDSLSSNVTLEPTDLYVRFLPQDSLQLDWLQNESGLELFAYPMDIRLEEGQEYVDPTIPDGMPGWYYTTVKPDYVFPQDIVHEVLEECYIPDEGEYIDAPSLANSGGGGWIDVERAAFERLGYELDPAPLETRANVKPRGTIRVWDESLATPGYVPVKGVKVRCHVIVKWSIGWTNSDGWYEMGSNFAIGPHYAIVYDNLHDFTIWGNWGFLAAANHNMGWHSQHGHNEDIGPGWNSRPWAIVNNAACDYYEMCHYTGISKPPAGLRIWVFRNGEDSHACMIRRVPWGSIFNQDNWATYLSYILGGPGAGTAALSVLDILSKWMQPDLVIGTENRTTYRQIYEVVSHELAHASHFSQVGVGYWSKFVSHIIDNRGYGDSRSGTNAGYCEVGEMWGYAMGFISEFERYNDSRLNGRYYYQPTNGWIYPHPLWSLITRGILTRKEIFDCLTSDVNKRNKLLGRLCARHPSQIDAIKIAFLADDIPVITGRQVPIVNTDNMTYSVPALGGGVAFTGWSVTGGVDGTDYRVLDSLTGTSLRIRFLTENRHTLTATFRLPDDTPATDNDNPTYSCSMTVDPITVDASVSGPDAVQEHEIARFEVPATLASGHTFDTYAITGGEFQVYSGALTGRIVSVEFLATGTYTVTAGYRHADGNVHNISKTMTVQPLVLTTPLVWYSFYNVIFNFAPPIETHPPGDPIDPLYMERWVDIYVENYQRGVTYQWKVDDEVMSEYPWLYSTVTLHDSAIEFTVSCRAHHNGDSSEWSYTVTVSDGGFEGTDPDDTITIATPVISANTALAQPGGTVTFSVNEPYSQFTYEWEKNDVILLGQSGPTVSVKSPVSTQTGVIGMRCRAKYGLGNASDWSDLLNIAIGEFALSD